MIYCTRCGTPNPDKAIYCVNDGYALHKHESTDLTSSSEGQIICRQCGTDQVNLAQYCYFCGESFELLSHNEIKYKPSNLHKSSINFDHFKRPFMLSIPFALLCVVFLYVFSSVSLTFLEYSEPTEAVLNESDDYEQYQFFHTYRSLTNSYDLMKLEANGRMQQHGVNPNNIEALSPVDLMLFGHLGKVQVSILEQSNNDNQPRDNDRLLESRPGLTFYFLLTAFSLVLAGMLYAFRIKISNEKEWVIHSLTFSAIYSLVIWMISIVTDYSDEIDHGSITQIISYLYPSFDILWKSFVISLMIILAVLSFKNDLKQTVYTMSLKVAFLTCISLISAYLIMSTYIIGNIHDLAPYQWLIGSSLISGIVLIAQLAMYLMNLAFLNTFVFNGQGLSTGFEYHLISKTSSNNEILQQSFHFLENYIWIMMVVTFIILLVFSRFFKGLSNKNKWISTVVYSLMLSLMLTGLTYASNLTHQISSNEFDEQYFVGFSYATILPVSFVISLLVTRIGSIQFKRRD